jgi:YHS domain-containing protein
MKTIIAIGIAMTLAAGAASAQCPGCPKAGGCSSMSGKTSGLAGLKLVSLAGDTVSLSDHVGMMPMVMLLVGTGEASGKAADIVQSAVSALGQPPMLAYVLVAGPKAAKTFAKSHGLTGMVLLDPKRTALAAAMADTFPLALFIDRYGTILKADAGLSETSVSFGLKSIAQAEDKQVDPVCGMTVTKEGAAGSAAYQGKTYYFCSTACKDNFAKDPQKYLAQ